MDKKKSLLKRDSTKSGGNKSKQDKNRRKSVHFSNKTESYDDVVLSENLAPRRKTLFDSDFSYFSSPSSASPTSSFININRKSSLLG